MATFMEMMENQGKFRLGDVAVSSRLAQHPQKLRSFAGSFGGCPHQDMAQLEDGSRCSRPLLQPGLAGPLECMLRISISGLNMS